MVRGGEVEGGTVSVIEQEDYDIGVTSIVSVVIQTAIQALALLHIGLVTLAKLLHLLSPST